MAGSNDMAVTAEMDDDIGVEMASFGEDTAPGTDAHTTGYVQG
jgi:hypothetical protein